MSRRRGVLAALGPGILIAATGVGAGDLLTAALAGSAAGLGILWAVVVGAVLKGFLNEGLARWQLASGQSLLEGWADRLGRPVAWIFAAYLVLWTFFTSGALVTACGVAGTGLLPLGDPETSKVVWGIVHAFVGLGLVAIGGFRLFERLMGACIAVMFVTVVAAAALLAPAPGAVLGGLALPTIPRGEELWWVLGLLGGVGGTVTLLSYGYWIREKGRSGAEGVRESRIDLSVGYAMTALFGVSMVIIGSRVEITRGPLVALDLANQLGDALGPLGRGVFLVGFWGAVFSSLLGVWQGVPYIFADLVAVLRTGRGLDAGEDATRRLSYRVYLVVVALCGLPLLFVSVTRAQLAYAVFGSLFMPFLALTLLVMGNRVAWIGERHRHRVATNVALGVTAFLFLALAILRR